MRRQQRTTKAGKGDTHVGRPGSRNCNFKVVLSPTARPFRLSKNDSLVIARPRRGRGNLAE